MRKPDKPSLHTYFIDGGCLLHKVRWIRGKTCEQLLQQYVTYVNSKFGSGVVVVFDGYGSMPSTKDHEHRWRQSRLSKVAPAVSLDATKQMFFDQQQFIANNHNKVEFIARLIVALNSAGLQTHQSSGDADTDIVAVVLHCASSGSVTVFADDTDILCLLLYHTFWSEGKKVKAIVISALI